MALTQASSSIEVIQSEVRYNQEPCNHDFTYCKIKPQEVLLTKFTTHPVKHSCKVFQEKVPFLPLLQDLARSCKILWDLGGFCRNLAQDSCTCKCKKKDLFLEDLARAFLLGWLVLNKLQWLTNCTYLFQLLLIISKQTSAHYGAWL